MNASRIPNLTPDGRASRERKTGDARRGPRHAEDPRIAGDTPGKGYANTDEAAPDAAGNVARRPDAPVI